MSERDGNKFPKVLSYEQFMSAQTPPESEPAPRPTPPTSAPAPVPAPKPASPAPVASEAELLSHNYDGIQEYDNPTPGWWYLIFGASIVFSVLYILIYQLGGLAPSPIQRHSAVQAAALEVRFAELSKIEMSENKLLQIMSTPSWLSQGESIFLATCALCHTADGRGSVGPNLTDETYKNIKTLMDIPNLIITGAGNGAMPSQQNTLSEDEIALVAAYAASLRGNNLPTGETVKPEFLGVAIDPWPVLADQVPDGSENSDAENTPEE